MKAIVQERFGPPDVLQLVDTDVPEVGAMTCWFGCMPPRSIRTTGTSCAATLSSRGSWGSGVDQAEGPGGRDPRGVAAERDRLSALLVEIVREPRRESWGLIEMWIADPDGVHIVLVEVPEDHPLRRDSRGVP
jgi:hypothetical protein